MPYKPPRIQGRRWLVFEFDDDDELVGIPGMARAELIAQCRARNLLHAVVIAIDTEEANRVARSPLARDGRLQIDETTVADFGRIIGTTVRHARRLLEQMIAEGTGRTGRIMRRRLLKRDSESRSSMPPHGIAELLADALAVALGPNAAFISELPRDWSAIATVAREVIADG